MSTGTEIQVVMPQMGVSVSEGTVTKWLKQVGEAVAQDEPLLEISTDKVDTEVPSPGEGVLAQVLVTEGQTVDVGTVLATIAPAGSPVAEPAGETPAPASAEAEPVAPTPVAPHRMRRRRSLQPHLLPRPHQHPHPRRSPLLLPPETGRASSRRSSPASPRSTAWTRLPSRAPAPAGA